MKLKLELDRNYQFDAMIARDLQLPKSRSSSTTTSHIHKAAILRPAGPLYLNSPLETSLSNITRKTTGCDQDLRGAWKGSIGLAPLEPNTSLNTSKRKTAKERYLNLPAACHNLSNSTLSGRTPHYRHHRHRQMAHMANPPTNDRGYRQMRNPPIAHRAWQISLSPIKYTAIPTKGMEPRTTVDLRILPTIHSTPSRFLTSNNNSRHRPLSNIRRPGTWVHPRNRPKKTGPRI